jgi:hypothetical protein
MIFNNQIEISLNEIRTTNFDLAFVGEALDERGNLICHELGMSIKKKVNVLALDAMDMSFCINGIHIEFRELNSYLDNLITNDEPKIFLLDATTLGVAELLYLLRWIQRKNKRYLVNILYAEPENYPPVFESSSDYGRHNFNLSSSSIGYKSLPGFTKTVPPSAKAHLIALLGFERVRLGQLLENDEGAYIGNVTPIFGVPGFKPSYDKHSAYQNIESLILKGEKPEFSSANNPYDTYKKLVLLKECLPHAVINIAPIGTKPMAIGACLFVLENMYKNVGVMYDHPIKNKGRTEGISTIHSYLVSF